eukprot:9356442-Pyramimonas_sp.AAC.1
MRVARALLTSGQCVASHAGFLANPLSSAQYYRHSHEFCGSHHNSTHHNPYHDASSRPRWTSSTRCRGSPRLRFEPQGRFGFWGVGSITQNDILAR